MNSLKKEVKIFCEKSKLKGNGHYVRSQRLNSFLKVNKCKSTVYCNKTTNQINKIIDDFKNPFYLILDFKNYKKIEIKKNIKILKTLVFENIDKIKFFNNVNIFPLDIQFTKNSGAEFYLFPKDFYSKRNSHKFKKFKKECIKILVIQGGTDANNNLNKIVKILKKDNLNFNYELIVKTNNIKSINKNIYNSKKVRIIGRVKNMSKVYDKIDIAVSSCGGLAFELGFMGIPTIHLTSEPREIIRAKLLEKKGLGIFCLPQNIKKLTYEINKIYIDEVYRKRLISKRLLFFRKKNKILKLLK
tara:strand:- start:11700 stop:12602 length:903 start_codon:yes stop_codon:yes gene_type:complete